MNINLMSSLHKNIQMMIWKTWKIQVWKIVINHKVWRLKKRVHFKGIRHHYAQIRAIFVNYNNLFQNTRRNSCMGHEADLQYQYHQYQMPLHVSSQSSNKVSFKNLDIYIYIKRCLFRWFYFVTKSIKIVRTHWHVPCGFEIIKLINTHKK